MKRLPQGHQVADLLGGQGAFPERFAARPTDYRAAVANEIIRQSRIVEPPGHGAPVAARGDDHQDPLLPQDLQHADGLPRQGPMLEERPVQIECSHPDAGHEACPFSRSAAALYFMKWSM